MHISPTISPARADNQVYYSPGQAQASSPAVNPKPVSPHNISNPPDALPAGFRPHADGTFEWKGERVPAALPLTSIHSDPYRDFQLAA